MRKILPFVLGGAVALFAITTLLFFGKYQKSSADFVAMQSQEQETRVRYGQAINEIATIQDSLNAIILGDGSQLTSTHLQSEMSVNMSETDQALARVAVLKAGIQRTKARIQELDARLKKSGVRIAGLEKMVTNLKLAVEEKEKQVAGLTVQVDSLQTEVTGLVATVEDNRKEMGTIYYLIGTKKDLATQGVVVAKGGVLGVGKTVKPSGNINENMFSSLDTDQETIIHIPASKAQVLTAQPVASYELQPAAGGMELRILDPCEFRKVKHLVIMT